MNYVADKRAREHRLHELRHEAEQDRLIQNLKNEKSEMGDTPKQHSAHKTLSMLVTLLTSSTR